MNFFKSVFSDEDPDSDPQPHSPEPEDEEPAPPTWGFVGGLIKTITTRSESVIETYKRDLQEFSSGLKLETQVLKEVASSSLEVGASKAQESLESVGQAIDNIGSVVWKSTSQIIANQATPDSDFDNSDSTHPGPNPNASLNNKYSRFEAQLRGIQGNVSTYLDECEDVGEFEKWNASFDLNEKAEEIEGLMRENGVMDGIYKRVVPSVVDHELFWLRYYYRVYKLEQAENVRAKLVERANEDEELSWDVDDDDDDEEEEEEGENANDNVQERKEAAKDVSESNEVVSEVEKKNVEEKTPSEGSKDSDITVVSTQPSRGQGEEEEEDLGWDEIEDIGSDDDDKKMKETESGGSPSNREELRKRLSVAEDDEDLSWDIEDDDDEQVKKS